MIRFANAGDVFQLTKLAQAYFASGAYWGDTREFSFRAFSNHLKDLINSPVAKVFVAEKNGTILGGIGVAVLPDVLTGQPVAMKIHWFATGGAGLRLERAARKWAKEQGATAFKMSAMNDNSAKILERLGYSRTEIIYSKAI